MSDTNYDIQDLFQQSHEDGDISQDALQTLSIQADMGVQIQAGLGINPDDVPVSDVVLVSIMPDDSYSINSGGNEKIVSDGHNLVIQSLAESKQRDNILGLTRYLNGHVLFPYSKIEDAIEMNSTNYSARLGTPLYDQTAVLLGTVLAKTLEFENAGVPVRTITLIITDGADAGSRQQTAQSVRVLVQDMIRQEKHIIAAMGINDGYTDFQRVFQDMGILPQWILTPGNSASEIRAAFQVFSQSAMQVSNSRADFNSGLVRGFWARKGGD